MAEVPDWQLDHLMRADGPAGGGAANADVVATGLIIPSPTAMMHASDVVRDCRGQGRGGGQARGEASSNAQQGSDRKYLTTPAAIP